MTRQFIPRELVREGNRLYDRIHAADQELARARAEFTRIEDRIERLKARADDVFPMPGIKKAGDPEMKALLETAREEARVQRTKMLDVERERDRLRRKLSREYVVFEGE